MGVSCVGGGGGHEDFSALSTASGEHGLELGSGRREVAGAARTEGHEGYGGYEGFDITQGDASTTSLRVQSDASYRGAILEAMQKQHQARLDEQSAAAERLLHAKETELTEMQTKLLEVGENAANVERRLVAELETEKKQHAETKAGFEETLMAQQLKFDSELQELKTIRTNELLQVKRRYEDELDELRCACDEQVATVSANRAAVLEGLTRKQSDDARAAQNARELAVTYEAQVKQLEGMLADESRRLTETREEQVQTTSSTFPVLERTVPARIALRTGWPLVAAGFATPHWSATRKRCGSGRRTASWGAGCSSSKPSCKRPSCRRHGRRRWPWPSWSSSERRWRTRLAT